MKKEKVTYIFDDKTGVGYCSIFEYGLEFTGIAVCHPDDRDILSERTGCEIANRRAYLELLYHERDNIIAPQLKALKQLYYSINKSKNFNKKGYAEKALYRHVRMLEHDLTAIKAEIATEKQSLKDYINGKEKFYQRHRAYLNYEKTIKGVAAETEAKND